MKIAPFVYLINGKLKVNSTGYFIRYASFQTHLNGYLPPVESDNNDYATNRSGGKIIRCSRGVWKPESTRETIERLDYCRL
ncbi:MAG TPA: hypothetical protein VFC63_19535 [Blastocatellia bacterium]|nr:hypothetical protein [Blastocatellia bacterium]